MLDKIAEKVNELKLPVYIAAMVFGTNFIMLLVSVLLQMLHLDQRIGGPDTAVLGFSFSVILGVLAGPLLESGVIVLGVKLLKKLGIRNRDVQFIATLILFSLLHSYSIAYMILIAIPSAVIIFSYLYYRSPYLPPFWVMTLVHGGYNLVNLLLHNFL